MDLKVTWEGFKDFENLLNEIENDFGEKDAKKILRNASREAMKPVLTMAKMNAPKDTGDLARTMQIEARRPTKKDIRSKYINETDSVIALITTKAFPKKLKKQFYEENAALYETDKAAYNKKLKEAKRTNNIIDIEIYSKELDNEQNNLADYYAAILKLIDI